MAADHQFEGFHKTPPWQPSESGSTPASPISPSQVDNNFTGYDNDRRYRSEGNDHNDHGSNDAGSHNPDSIATSSEGAASVNPEAPSSSQHGASAAEASEDILGNPSEQGGYQFAEDTQAPMGNPVAGSNRIDSSGGHNSGNDVAGGDAAAANQGEKVVVVVRYPDPFRARYTAEKKVEVNPERWGATCTGYTLNERLRKSFEEQVGDFRVFYDTKDEKDKDDSRRNYVEPSPDEIVDLKDKDGNPQVFTLIPTGAPPAPLEANGERRNLTRLLLPLAAEVQIPDSRLQNWWLRQVRSWWGSSSSSSPPTSSSSYSFLRMKIARKQRRAKMETIRVLFYFYQDLTVQKLYERVRERLSESDKQREFIIFYVEKDKGCSRVYLGENSNDECLKSLIENRTKFELFFTGKK